MAPPATPGHAEPSLVGFAVTDGPSHVLRYANAFFRRLLASGEVAIGMPPTPGRLGADLTPLLDEAYANPTTTNAVRGELRAVPGGAPRWNCAVWQVSSEAAPPYGLVIEVRDSAHVEPGIARQRAITEQFLLGALRERDSVEREQENARQAVSAECRASLLAHASRDLALSLDETATREAVARRVLFPEGTWCIVDLMTPIGGTLRLAVVHPDPAKQVMAQALADSWVVEQRNLVGAAELARSQVKLPFVVPHEAAAALTVPVAGAADAPPPPAMDYGDVLVAPLVVRGAGIGAMAFVSPRRGTSFSNDEIELASDSRTGAPWRWTTRASIEKPTRFASPPMRRIARSPRSSAT